MGKVMIDTSVLIELLEKEPLERLEKLATSYEFYISGIVVFEFLVGIYRTGKIKLKELLEEFFVIIPVTYDIITKAAQIEADLMKVGKMLEPRDTIIAATAIVLGIPLWTKNMQDFSRLKKYGLTLAKIEK